MESDRLAVRGLTVFTLRCTRKLLARLKATPALDRVEPTTVLGDWYANLLLVRGEQVVLFVNERSLLPVLLRAAPTADLVERFRVAATSMLLRLGVPASAVAEERRQMVDVRVAKTENRRVVGTMTDFAFLLESYRTGHDTLDDLALRLASTPCSPIGMKYPVDVVTEVFGGDTARLSPTVLHGAAARHEFTFTTPKSVFERRSGSELERRKQAPPGVAFYLIQKLLAFTPPPRP